MVDFAFVRQEFPFVSFLFTRLGGFLKYFASQRPRVGLFLPLFCVAFRPILLTLYPLIRHSLIRYHLEMATVANRDVEIGSSELEMGLSLNVESMGKEVDTAMSKLSPSSSSILLHALSESCSLKGKQLRGFRKRF